MKLTILPILIALVALLFPAPAARAQLGREKGEAFLAENGKKDGVKTLPSGLQFRVLKEGVGRQPTKDDSVVVHYRGMLIDGREFDSSHKRNEPAEFGVGQVIKGWTEALQLMKEGSKWLIYVPWSLAYGDRGPGRPGLIGPFETLVFEVELIRVK